LIPLPAYKFGLIFRLVEPGDAGFILSLRTNARLSRHLSPTEDNLEVQRKWINNYKEREAKGTEYYFLYSDKDNRPIGVFRVYNITKDSLTSGSWLSNPSEDALIAAKTDLFLIELIFEELKVSKCFIDVRKDNKKMIRYHNMFFKRLAEDEQNIYFFMDREGYLRKHHFLSEILSPTK